MNNNSGVNIIMIELPQHQSIYWCKKMQTSIIYTLSFIILTYLPTYDIYRYIQDILVLEEKWRNLRMFIFDYNRRYVVMQPLLHILAQFKKNQKGELEFYGSFMEKVGIFVIHKHSYIRIMQQKSHHFQSKLIYIFIFIYDITTFSFIFP